jgi:hypothetical protein
MSDQITITQLEYDQLVEQASYREGAAPTWLVPQGPPVSPEPQDLAIRADAIDLFGERK